MRELALNILDIAQNSVVANATTVTVDVYIDLGEDILRLKIVDNGKGMEQDFLDKVADPFATTRTTRKVGLGLPFLKMDAENSAGTFDIASLVGVGTTVITTYRISHVDRPPLGDLSQTMSMLICGSPDVNWKMNFTVRNDLRYESFKFDSIQLKEVLGGKVQFDEPEIAMWVLDYLKENLDEIYTKYLGGTAI